MELTDVLAPWTAQLPRLVPDLRIFDAHTHIGQNDPDGMSQTPEQLLSGLRGAGAVGAFTFAMHEPDGYPPANDMILEVVADTDPELVPFCRVSPNTGSAPAEAVRALDAGARGIKLHPRAEQFTLDHPAVAELAAIAADRGLPMLVHAGRGIPALGAHMVTLAAEHPHARFILAHAGITDLAWLWRDAPATPNLLFDSSWWIGPDLLTLFALVPPGQVVFASDAPYGHTLVSALSQLRLMLQSRLSVDQIRGIMAGQALRIAARDALLELGGAVGEHARRAGGGRILLERVVTFTTLGALAMIRGDHDGRGREQLSLARLACNVPDDLEDAPVFAAVAGLLDAFATLSEADPDARAPRTLLMLAISVARAPDVPLPEGL